MPTPNDDLKEFENSDPFADDLTPNDSAKIERRMNIHRLKRNGRG